MKNLINNILLKFGYIIKKTTTKSAEDDVLEILKHVIKNNEPVIYDVGSNVGGVINNYLQIFPNAIIHAFEPDGDLFDKLSSLNKKNVKVHKLAVSNKIGEVFFNV